MKSKDSGPGSSSFTDAFNPLFVRHNIRMPHDFLSISTLQIWGRGGGSEIFENPGAGGGGQILGGGSSPPPGHF